MTTPEQTYLAHHAIEHRDRLKTVKNTKAAVLHFEKWRDDRPITVPLLQDYRTHLANKRSSFDRAWTAAHRNLNLNIVKAMLAWLNLREVVTLKNENVRKALELFPTTRSLPRVLTRQEIAEFVKVCKRNGETGRTALALLFTGARFNEIMALRPKHVTDAGVVIMGTKTRVERLFPVALLGDARSIFSMTPFLWRQSAWNKLRMELSFKVKVKDLRSNFATYAMSSGKVTLYQCASLLGHSASILESKYLGPAVWGVKGATVLDWMEVAV